MVDFIFFVFESAHREGREICLWLKGKEKPEIPGFARIGVLIKTSIGPKDTAFDLRRAEEKLGAQAKKDQLTGMPRDVIEHP